MADKVRIGLLGGPGSGKTTYLSALRIATLLDPSGEWTINGMDSAFPGSTAFLARQTNLLNSGQFPEASRGVRDYGYTLSGISTDPINRVRQLANRGREIDMQLQFRDRPGGYYLDITDPGDELWSYLAECQGLIYLFDPELEEGPNKNFMYLQQSVDYIRQATDARRLMEGRRLPHFLAACITKYDEPATFKRLNGSGFITPGRRDGSPTVNNPSKAFQSLVDRLTMPTIERNFLKSRVHHYFLSAIGFYANSDGKVDIEDCCNIIETPQGRCVRGTATPINVFAPLLWIENQIMKETAS